MTEMPNCPKCQSRLRRILELEAEAVFLRADNERVDWILRNVTVSETYSGLVVYKLLLPYNANFRQAIDEAMKEGGA